MHTAALNRTRPFLFLMVLITYRLAAQNPGSVEQDKFLALKFYHEKNYPASHRHFAAIAGRLDEEQQVFYINTLAKCKGTEAALAYLRDNLNGQMYFSKVESSYLDESMQPHRAEIERIVTRNNRLFAQRYPQTPLFGEIVSRLETDQLNRKKLVDVYWARYGMQSDSTRNFDQQIINNDAANFRFIREELKKATPAAVHRLLTCPATMRAIFYIMQHSFEEADRQDLLSRLEQLKQPADNHLRYKMYLTDRIRASRQEPQLYGTQFEMQDGKLVPKPLKSVAEADTMRVAAGLLTVAHQQVIINMTLGK
jgi:hypothetical protein